MFRRLLEGFHARRNPLAAKQFKAVKLQERFGKWPALFFEELTTEQVQYAISSPPLREAERLFKEIKTEGSSVLTPGQMAVTTYQLALLVHRKGRLDEAHTLYREVVQICRLASLSTDTVEWALSRALFRLGEMTVREDRAKGQALFDESLEMAKRRRDAEVIKKNRMAVQYFGL